MPFCAFVLLPTSGGLFAQQNAWVDSSIDSLLRDRVASKRSTGIVLGIVEPGRAPKILTAAPARVSRSTSNSVLRDRLGNQGLHDRPARRHGPARRSELDDPISSSWDRKSGSLHEEASRSPCSISQLESSGLPRLPTNLKPATWPIRTLAIRFSSCTNLLLSYSCPADNRIKSSSYSDLGMGLLGHVLALAPAKVTTLHS